LRFAQISPPWIDVGAGGEATGAAGEAIRLLDRDSTRIEQATGGSRTPRAAQRIAPDRKKSAPATRRWLAGGVTGSGRPAPGKIRHMTFAELKQRLDLYEKPMRLDKPIGTLLLLWPTLRC
jgi:hypothetical protein